MECTVRQWRIEDASDLAEIVNNKNILNNLRNGLPYPYTIKDAKEYIQAMILADKTKIFAFAVTVNEKVVGSTSATRCENIHFRTGEIGYLRNRLPIIQLLAVCLKKRVFNLEGILRANAVKNGKLLDMKMYAKVKKF